MRFLLLVILVCSATLVGAEGIGHLVYRPDCAPDEAGILKGALRPRKLIYTLFLRHRQSRRVYARNVGLTSVKSSFQFQLLDPGTYDLIILPLNDKDGFPVAKDYPVMVGQPIKPEYNGTTLPKADRNALRDFMQATLPGMLKETYTQCDAHLLRKSPHVSADYKDMELDATEPVKVGALQLIPCLSFMKQQPVTRPLDYLSTRTLKLVGGNPNRAFVIAHAQERFVFASNPSTTATLTTGAAAEDPACKPRCEDFQYDELFFFSKNDGRWTLDQRQPINVRELIYHIPGYPNRDINYRNVYYYVSGPLVGINVLSTQTTDLGRLTMSHTRASGATPQLAQTPAVESDHEPVLVARHTSSRRRSTRRSTASESSSSSSSSTGRKSRKVAKASDEDEESRPARKSSSASRTTRRRASTKTSAKESQSARSSSTKSSTRKAAASEEERTASSTKQATQKKTPARTAKKTGSESAKKTGSEAAKKSSSSTDQSS